MPAIDFMARLAPAVSSGAKQRTVRKVRSTPIVPGDRLVLYTGMRTKACRKLMETRCSHIDTINVARAADTHEAVFTIDGDELSADEAERFANADGIDSAHELTRWLESNYGLPFDGVVIHWHYPPITTNSHE